MNVKESMNPYPAPSVGEEVTILGLGIVIIRRPVTAAQTGYFR